MGRRRTTINAHRIVTAIDPNAMGVELSWSFGYGSAEAVTIPRNVAERIIERNGFTPAVHLPRMDASRALKQAAKLAPKSKTLVVKELARPNSDSPRVYGVYTRTARDGEKGDGWTMGARVRAVGDCVNWLPPEGTHEYGSKEAKRVAQEMNRRANLLVDNVFNQDLSNAFTSIGSELGWINRRRNSGGVYYMNNSRSAATLVRLLLDFKAETASQHPSRHFVPEIIEVYPQPLAKATITAAATYHFDARIRTLVEQLKKAATEGTMRDKTLTARADEAQRLIDQAAEYQELLAGGAKEIAEKLDIVRTYYTTGLVQGCEALKAELDAFDKLMPSIPEITPPAAPEDEQLMVLDDIDTDLAADFDAMGV
jgi:hypothetical protein